MKIGLIIAIERELKSFLNNGSDIKSYTVSNRTVYETKIGNHIEWLELSRSLGIQLVLGSVIDPSIMKKYLDEGCLFSSNKPVTLVKAIDELNKEQKATE